MTSRPLSNAILEWAALILPALLAAAASADMPDDLAPLDMFQECPDCPEMIVLPLGEFVMGAPMEQSAEIDFNPRAEGEPRGRRTEQPIHTVTIDLPYALARYEVTTGEFMRCVEAGACSYTPTQLFDEEDYSDAEKLRLPVRDVNAYDIGEYLGWLNGLVGAEVYRLPTEAEWEYAARAGTTTRYATGENLPLDRFNALKPDADPLSLRPVPVDAMDASNAWGFQHIAGNVVEATMSCWTEFHLGLETSGEYLTAAQHEGKCERIVVKGGSYNSGQLYSRPATRGGPRVTARSYFLGFRIARDLEFERK